MTQWEFKHLVAGDYVSIHGSEYAWRVNDAPSLKDGVLTVRVTQGTDNNRDVRREDIKRRVYPGG